jgi:hypothetical protein
MHFILVLYNWAINLHPFVTPEGQQGWYLFGSPQLFGMCGQEGTCSKYLKNGNLQLSSLEAQKNALQLGHMSGGNA